MSTAVVTSKGQITIPKDVRERLKLRPGSRVRFVVEGADVASMRRETVSIRELAGFLAPAPRHLTLDDMNQAVESGAVERLRRASPDKKRR